ncbi:MAG: hypothetical protein GPJ51_10010, partial [Candidatus Heimdallarchaeota archaeon]|nr:hypothetical protein [Candidatus Heimdallarchaeota archaeon]
VNGKLERIDKSSDQRHVFRFIEITRDLTKRTIPESIFMEAFFHFQYLNDLLQESHSNDVLFNNDDMLAYFLAILDTTLLFHGQELQEKQLNRILKFWGVEQEFNVFSRKITQAKTILENANLLRDNSKICFEELLFKSKLLIDYLKDILPQNPDQLEQILEHIENLAQKRIIPYASISDAALIMIVSFFPLCLKVPAVKLFTMLQLREDLNIDLALFRKDVDRYRNRLERFNLFD